MSESRQINFSVNLDTSQVPRQAEQSSKAVRAELEKQKQVIDRIMTELVASGGKLKVPIEDFRNAATAAGAALDRMGESNAQALERLYPKYEQLKAKIQEAYNSGNMQAVIGLQNGQQRAVEMEIKSRERLDKEIIKQWTALEALSKKVEQNAAASRNSEQAVKTLSQRLAECKKQMQELAAAGKQNTKEYQEASAKAKEYSKALQQVSSDSKPDAQVRLRTALMNAKQAMAEAEKEFGRGSIQFKQARDEAIRLQQAMNGMNKQVKALSAPNATYQGIINGLSGISGAASAATGMMALFGGESQQTAQAMAKLQAIMSITMGLQSMSMMLNKNSAVQLNIIGRLTTWWATCKAKAAAATTAETAAVVTNTGAQTVQTAAVQAGTTANVAHAASWKAVGIAIKSVPVFGWIVAGISALIAVISLLTKKTDEEIEAEKRRKEQLEETRRTQEQFRNTYASTATELIRKYKDLQVAWRKLTNEHQRQKWIKDNASSFKRLGKTIATTAEAENFLVKNTDNVVRALKARAMALAAQEMQQDAYKQYLADMLDLERNGTVANGGMYNVYKRNTGWSTSMYNMRSDEHKAAGVTLADYDQRTVTKRSGSTVYDTTEYSEKESVAQKINAYRKKQAQQLRQQLIKEIEQRWNEVETFTDAEIQKQQAIIDAADLNFDLNFDDTDDGGNPKRDPNAAAKARIALTDAEIKAMRDRNRQLLQLAFDREQAEIDIEKNGLKKRMMQRDLNQRMEDAQLQQQLEDQIQAEIDRARTLFEAKERAAKAAAEAKGKTYTEKQFNAGDLYSANIAVGMTSEEARAISTGDVDSSRIQALIEYYNLMGLITQEAQQQRREAEQEADRLAMQEYLKEYGTFEEKKTAIAAIYAAKRAKATTDAERMTLMQEEKAALDGLDFDDFVTNRAALAFGEVQNLTQATISELITELEKYRDKITATFDPEKIEKFNKALADLKRAQAMGQGNIFSQFFTPDFLKERRAAQAEIDDAERAHNALLDTKLQKEDEVKRKIEEIIAKVKELTGQELTSAQVTDGSTISTLIGQLSQPGQTDANKQGAADLSGLIDNLGKARTELGNVTTASDTAGNALGQLKEAFAAKFTGQGGTLAMIDTIVHGINDIIQGARETINELASTADALGADTSVGSGWDKATTIIGALGDASEGATQAWESLKSGNVMGVVAGVTKSFTAIIKGFAALHDASRERTIQRLQDEIDELERLNRRIEHRLESQYSKQARDSYNEEIRNLEKQRKLIQQQIEAERDKKDTDDDRIKEWEDQYEELGWKIEEYKDKAIDAIIGEDISTSIDNFADKLADSWGKVGERARAAKDFVKTMLRQMVLEAMKTNLEDPIRRLREMMAKALEDDVVTEAEQKELEIFAQQLAEETERKYKWADNIINNSNSSQSGATTGTFATASQDSITELSGRAAAIHTSGEMRRELLVVISEELKELRIKNDANRENETEIRNLVFLAVGHLETIARNTHELYEMNQRLEKIEKNTSRL